MLNADQMPFNDCCDSISSAETIPGYDADPKSSPANELTNIVSPTKQHDIVDVLDSQTQRESAIDAVGRQQQKDQTTSHEKVTFIVFFLF